MQKASDNHLALGSELGSALPSAAEFGGPKVSAARAASRRLNFTSLRVSGSMLLFFLKCPYASLLTLHFDKSSYLSNDRLCFCAGEERDLSCCWAPKVEKMFHFRRNLRNQCGIQANVSSCILQNDAEP